MVTEADAPISCSARGSTDAGPAPRQTFTVGTSWRILLQAQRSSGKLRNEPFWKVMSFVRRRRKALHEAEGFGIGLGGGG